MPTLNDGCSSASKAGCLVASERALGRDAAIGGVALLACAARATSAARALVRRGVPDVAAGLALPPELAPGSHSDPVGINRAVQLRVQLDDELGPQRG